MPPDSHKNSYALQFGESLMWKNKKGQIDDESGRMERCPNASAHYDRMFEEAHGKINKISFREMIKVT